MRQPLAAAALRPGRVRSRNPSYVILIIYSHTLRIALGLEADGSLSEGVTTGFLTLDLQLVHMTFVPIDGHIQTRRKEMLVNVELLQW